MYKHPEDIFSLFETQRIHKRRDHGLYCIVALIKKIWKLVNTSDRNLSVKRERRVDDYVLQIKKIEITITDEAMSFLKTLSPHTLITEVDAGLVYIGSNKLGSDVLCYDRSCDIFTIITK